MSSFTLRSKGSKRVLPEGLRFCQEPFASEEHCDEERDLERVFVRLKIPFFKNLVATVKVQKQCLQLLVI